MSILRSLNTGATGLRSHGTAIGVTGDNIANVNTVGFKRSRAVFQDILGRSVGETNGMPESGGGSKLGHIQQMWSQGSLLTTDSPTDLALSGEGFFIVNGNVNGVQSSFYTRAGQFNLNVDNQLVNADGLVVQGYLADATGQIGVTLGDLQLPEGTIQATPTTTVDIAANLDVNAPVPAAWDVNNPDTTSNFATGVNVYDSLGNAHQISVYFRNQGGGDWEWHAVADGGEITGGTAGVPFEAASGTLNFTTDGVLNTETPAASSWDFLNATAGQAIAFDFGTSIADGGLGTDGTTQYGAASTTTAISQDGFAAGSIGGIKVESDGTVIGVFTNGQNRTLAQVAVADFASVDGLDRAGQGLWVAGQDSGEPVVGAAETGGRGSIVAGALEQANVDLGQEFVDLISYQRGFQANSRIITTADEMYGELVNLKR